MPADKTRPPLIFNATVKASPEQVFRAFFEAPERWLCREHSIDPRVGGTIRLCWPDGCCEGSFVQCEPPTLARFTWRAVGDAMPETMVVVRIEDAQAGATADATATTVELEHYGFGIGPDWDPMYVGAARAWSAYLKNLRAVLEAGLDLREPNE
jgi:uncharacterized protein YndB with AHSA1/START domain